MTPCRACYGGQFLVECCDGSGGCSCGGGMIDMGPCRVCRGSGEHDEDADQSANLREIQGYGFIGTGPRGGFFGCKAMGKVRR
jgi:hypothetical protein